MKSSVEAILARLQSGDPKGAEAGCKDILEKQPGHPDALHLLGCARLQRGRPEEAIRLMRRAIDNAPVVPLYHENLAEAYYKHGDLDQADLLGARPAAEAEM